MESLENTDPIDDQITNQDDSVTNKDGDNDLEQGSEPNVQDKPDEVRVPTVTPAHDDAGDPTPTDIEEGGDPGDESDPSNTDAGPAGENL